MIQKAILPTVFAVAVLGCRESRVAQVDQTNKKAACSKLVRDLNAIAIQNGITEEEAVKLVRGKVQDVRMLWRDNWAWNLKINNIGDLAEIGARMTKRTEDQSPRWIGLYGDRVPKDQIKGIFVGQMEPEMCNPNEDDALASLWQAIAFYFHIPEGSPDFKE